ncbi:hypothetical protein ACQY0O_000167 [Thecaphora frezii]
MDAIMETPDRERAILQQRAASAAAVTSFPGQTPDSKELLASHPHLQHQIKSSPTSASSDSFSSYIHKDAAIIQHRSSSPRAESGSQESGDALSGPGSPRSRVQARLDAAALDAHRRLPSFDFSHPILPMRSVSATTPIRGGSFPRADRHVVRVHESAAVDVSQLREQVRAQSLHHETFAPMSVATLYHRPAHEGLPQWEREGSAVSASFTDNKENDKAGQREENSKGEIRRRRRTRPDEANVLATAYAENAFPDQETRQRLADQVGMTVRAVSVWFQNRRQAEKKRSGRYGGSGIVGGGVSRPAQPAAAAARVVPTHPLKAEGSSHGGTASTAAPGPAARYPLTSTPVKGDHVSSASLPAPIDFSQSNKENVPPWAAAADGLGREPEGAKIDTANESFGDISSQRGPLGFQRSGSRDLRDLIIAASPDFRHGGTEILPSSHEASASVRAGAFALAHAGFARVRSAPRMSLDEVLSRRPSEADATLNDRSSDIEDESSSTILPPRRLLSRAASTSTLSLVTTAGGRASLGSITPQPDRSASAVKGASLNARLPPDVTATLQRQGVIASADDELQEEQRKAKLIWQRMQSSSASSSEADRLGSEGGRKEREEDEETTLRIIANRRAARAQASGRRHAGLLDADARSAIHQQRPVQASPAAAAVAGAAAAADGSQPSLGSRLGLSKRTPSLDWAAGRDRSATVALPQRTASTLVVKGAGPAAAPNTATLARPEPEAKALPRSGARRTASQTLKRSGTTVAPSLPPATATPFRSTKPTNGALHGSAATTPLPPSRRSSPRKKAMPATSAPAAPTMPLAAAPAVPAAAAPAPQANDENVFGGPPLSRTMRATPGSPKRRRIEQPEPTPERDVGGHPASLMRNADRVLGSPMFVSRGMMHPHSFPSSSHPAFLSTPRTLASSPFKGSGLPLSARSDRIAFRTLAGSPATTPSSCKLAIPDSARASFEKPRVRPFQSARESSARDQRRPLGDRSNGSRTPSQESNDSGSHSHTSDEWASNLSRDAGSAAAAASFLSATPSRILAEVGHGNGVTMSAERVSNRHDDSGFFGSESEEEQPLAAVRTKSVLGAVVGGHSRWAKSRSSPVVPRKRKGGSGDASDDQRAAELLLGLGQRHEAQSQ